ncbi:hypothetical protein [Celerinatantimonas diazotrophica]|uniref:Lipoprotein n=1 Tax=Celerinatantimonas diazotrophica TaxID=412034 RepID=A0A4R1K566_9GAMM|nr:hypothetical protein [Celerinatantimonas diazotrophica]TCK59087.1 hypothetical protein EV690_1253 [Celerinatantimonas diazotrophica]CAG9297725.1 hypothetical protein CEDIAZO_02914 [Celerinatantimonas diazotrophica]
MKKLLIVLMTMSALVALVGCSSVPSKPVQYRVMTMKWGQNQQAAPDPRCQSFRFSPADVVNFFEHAQGVSPKLFRKVAQNSSCNYHGLLMVDGDIQQWMVTAAGVGYLSRGIKGTENRHFICSDSCAKVFGNRLHHYQLP